MKSITKLRNGTSRPADIHSTFASPSAYHEPQTLAVIAMPIQTACIANAQCQSTQDVIFKRGGHAQKWALERPCSLALWGSAGWKPVQSLSVDMCDCALKFCSSCALVATCCILEVSTGVLSFVGSGFTNISSLHSANTRCGTTNLQPHEPSLRIHLRPQTQNSVNRP